MDGNSALRVDSVLNYFSFDGRRQLDGSVGERGNNLLRSSKMSHSNLQSSDGLYSSQTTAPTSVSNTPAATNLISRPISQEELDSGFSKKCEKIIIILVGLPGTGKSSIARQLCHHVAAAKYKAKNYNAGDIRRRLRSNISDSSEFFDPSNDQAKLARDAYAFVALRNLIDDLKLGIINLGILDATNTTIKRREKLIRSIRESNVAAKHVIILDVQCDDQRLLAYNFSRKVNNMDYVSKDYSSAIHDFKDRFHNYTKAYQSVSEEELKDYDGTVDSYIKVVNGVERYEIHLRKHFEDSPLFGVMKDFLQNYKFRERTSYLNLASKYKTVNVD